MHSIYVNNALIPPTTIEQIPTPYTDILAQLSCHPTPVSQTHINCKPLQRPPLPRSTKELCAILLCHISIDNYVILIGGDFNLHYSLWNPGGCIAQETRGKIRVQTMIEANFRTR